MTEATTKARVVQALVKEKSELEDGWKLTCDIASFKSQYPTILNRVPGTDASRLKQGQTYNLRIARGNPKKGKDGSDRDWDYWWNYQGIAPDGAEAESRPIGATDYEAAKRLSIHRQVAVKLAMEAGPEINWVQVFQRALRIVHFLETGLDLAQKSVPAPAPAPQMPKKATQQVASATQAPQGDVQHVQGRPSLILDIATWKLELNWTYKKMAEWVKAKLPGLVMYVTASTLDITHMEDSQVQALHAALYAEIQAKAAKDVEKTE